MQLDEFEVLVPLTKAEADLREEQEEIIKKEIGSFVRLGLALAKIRDARLYKSTHKQWSLYLKDVLDIARQTADQRISAAKVVENLKAITEEKVAAMAATFEAASQPGMETTILLPMNERQARPLTVLPPDEQRAAWLLALEKSKDTGKITASQVKRAVSHYRGTAVVEKAKRRRKAAANSNEGEKLSPIIAELFEKLIDAIGDEIKSRWATSDKEEAAEMARFLLAAIEGR